MLTLFRRFFASKLGLGLVLAFIGLIAFAFASMDISSTADFSGGGVRDSVAEVDGREIGADELEQAVQDDLAVVRQSDPNATVQTLLADRGIGAVLDTLISRFVILAWSEENGLRAGRNLVNSEIQQLPAVRGPTGLFDPAQYNQFLRTLGNTDAQFRERLATTLLYRQSIQAATFGARLPDGLARSYARTFKERRSGAIASLPGANFAPRGGPTPAQLAAFYNDNTRLFIRPERRVLRYAIFDDDALGSAVEPTDAEIAAFYRENAAQFAASQRRAFTQLIVPTEAAAQALARRVRGGESFAAAASGAGLRPAELSALTREDLRAQTSANVATAYFAADQGAITKPARSPLGWHIARVTSIERQPARTLEAARLEIANTLRQGKREEAFAELAARTEDLLADGASLDAVTRDTRRAVTTTPPLLASGQIYGTAQPAPADVAAFLATAFQVAENEPEIAGLPDGRFAVFEVDRITPSAAAPLAEIRDDVIAAWRRSEGNKAAEAAARRIVARVERGASLTAAVAAERTALPPVRTVAYSREELARRGSESVEAPVALLFSMAQGTAKKLEAPAGAGWYVVDLDRISFDPLAADDPLIAQAKVELGRSWSAEYAEQMLAAMRTAVGVERNPSAVAGVRARLLGTSD